MEPGSQPLSRWAGRIWFVLFFVFSLGFFSWLFSPADRGLGSIALVTGLAVIGAWGASYRMLPWIRDVWWIRSCERWRARRKCRREGDQVVYDPHGYDPPPWDDQRSFDERYPSLDRKVVRSSVESGRVDDADPRAPGFGDNNVIFTRERAEAALERIRKKLRMEAAPRPSAPDDCREAQRQPSPFEQRLMLALGLKSVQQLDKILAQPTSHQAELHSEPPDEEFELMDRAHEEMDRIYQEEQAKQRTEREGGKPDDLLGGSEPKPPSR
jgi:hypothetical protein